VIEVRNGRGPFSRCSHKIMIRWGLGVGSEKIRNTDRALDDGGDHSACPHFCSGRLLRRPELRPTLQAGDVPETGNADIAGRCGGTVRPSRAGSFSERLWSQRSSDRNAKKCRSSSRRQLNQRRSNCLKEGKEVREGSRTLYTISYTVDDASNEVSFDYDSNKGTIIRVKNQEKVARRKDQDS